MTAMVIRIRKGARGHLFIKEWMEFRGLSPETIANRLEVARETVYRWLREQHRLDPGKIAQIAAALDCEPQELWTLPNSRPSLDALAAEVDDETHRVAVEMVRRLAGKH